MKNIAVSLMLAASLCLAACSGGKEKLTQDEALNPTEAANAIAQAEADAKAARESEVAKLNEQLTAASQIEELAEVVTQASAHPKIKKAAQEKLEKQVRPIIDSENKSWAHLDKLMQQLPNSNPLWTDAWSKKEQLKAAAKK